MKHFFLITGMVAALGLGAFWLCGESPSPIVFPASVSSNQSLGTNTPDSPDERQLPHSPSSSAVISHSITAAGIVPSELPAGSNEPVVVTAIISDPTVVTSGVNLIQMSASGSATVIGTLQNTGNSLFTLTTNFSQLPPQKLDLRISGAFVGSLKRVQSPDFFLAIDPATSTSGWLTASPDNLFTITLPPEMQIAADPLVPGSYYLTLSDGTELAIIVVLTPPQWVSLTQEDTDAPLPVLASESSSTAVAYSLSENDSNTLGLDENAVYAQLLQALSSIHAN